MDSELEVIRTEMEVTRGSLSQKIGELESQVRDTVSEAGHAVEATKEGVKEVVASVSDTVTSVKESLKDTFNLSKHVEDHPWAAFGVAVAVGAVGAFLLRPSRGFHGSAFAPSAPASPPPSRIPAYAAAAATASTEPGMIGSILTKLQGLAVHSLTDVVEDLIKQSAPESWRGGLQDIVHDLAGQLTDEKPHYSSSNGSH